jgi:hypothetical protein
LLVDFVVELAFDSVWLILFDWAWSWSAIVKNLWWWR